MARTKGSTSARTLSYYGEEALTLLGQLIRAGRIERKISVQQLAERVGVSRDMIRRIENGDPRCGIGSVFEAATIVGVPLFEAEESRLSMRVAEQAEKLQLMPKTVRETKEVVRDDF
ncbi:helix-turn-helix transcriptional regulator [Minwuia sp. IMCC3060]|uniref:helix-turn-helix domain-containing protein n=1 Tax=Minwuia sp. IMCC3060 TaxID=3040675 RepID=UPI0024788466|nr:helix-turn-helix transcriptional regulator [Minwuia sp. IMCC3060]